MSEAMHTGAYVGHGTWSAAWDEPIYDITYYWDVEAQEIRHDWGYYEIDAMPEVIANWKNKIRNDYSKHREALIDEARKSFGKGDTVVVVKGRKTPKGTQLTVFWVGDRPTYMGYGTERIAGAYDLNGNKVWIKAEYCRNVADVDEAAIKRDYVQCRMLDYCQR